MAYIMDNIQNLLLLGSVVAIAFFLVLYIVQKVISTPFPIIKRHRLEQFFLDPVSIKNVDFPSIEDPPTLDLSVIVPAYNEQNRLTAMLDECLTLLEEKSKTGNFNYEVIVVSDGSHDDTVPLALKYSKRYTVEKVRVMELLENRGKGGAVRLGMLSARGKNLLFADADGATKFSDLDKLLERLETSSNPSDKEIVVIGSRAHLEEESIATRSAFRTFLMHGFHLLVWLFTVRSVRDTQCGFKLFTRSAARKLFKIMHVEKWAFDVELLYLAEKLKIEIAEVAVNWHEIEGSKLTPFWSSFQMGKDLFLIWFRYTTGAWIIPSNKNHTD